MAIAGAVGLVRALGVGPCGAYLEKLIANITKVANGEALCQLAEEDEEEMEEEEEQEVSYPLSALCQMEEGLGPYQTHQASAKGRGERGTPENLDEIMLMVVGDELPTLLYVL